MFLAFPFQGSTQDSSCTSTPKYSNEFLAIGVGGRSLGMSNSSVASINDVTSGYWNPAGLLGIKNDMQVGLMHSEYFAGIAKYDGCPVPDRDKDGVNDEEDKCPDVPGTVANNGCPEVKEVNELSEVSEDISNENLEKKKFHKTDKCYMYIIWKKE